MLISLEPNQITITPIRFGYVNENRDFLDGYSLSGDLGFHTELSAVYDFSINYNSVNLLTEPRTRFGGSRNYQSLAVFSQSAPETLAGAPEPCFNYWATFPQHAFNGEDTCSLVGNILPLKNNFSESGDPTCSTCYRTYGKLNFGELGYDHYRPSFLFSSNYRTIESSENVFTFRIPDFSDPIDPNDINFTCFGSLMGDCPENSDQIVWGGGNVTWLSGTECSGVWVDRIYGVSGTCLSSESELESVLYEDIYPSELLLVSGTNYTYRRPDINKQLDFIQERCIDDNQDIEGRFIFLSDAGVSGDNQLSAADLIYRSGEIAGVFFGGNNNELSGLSGDMDANWDAFDPLITEEIAYPALGDKDISVNTLGEAQTDYFTYLPNNKRYYNVYFPNSSLELFVLNSGTQTNGTLVEPDGNTIGSVQYNWFVDALAVSEAKYRVVMFHQPYASSLEDTSKLLTSMNWNFDDMPIDLILNGHTKSNQHFTHNGLDIIDCSAVIEATGVIDVEGGVNGSGSGFTKVWTDSANGASDSQPALVYLDASPCGLDVTFVNINTHQAMYHFQINNRRGETITEQECEEENGQGVFFRSSEISGDILLDSSGSNNNAKIIY